MLWYCEHNLLFFLSLCGSCNLSLLGSVLEFLPPSCAIFTSRHNFSIDFNGLLDMVLWHKAILKKMTWTVPVKLLFLYILSWHIRTVIFISPPQLTFITRHSSIIGSHISVHCIHWRFWADACGFVISGLWFIQLYHLCSIFDLNELPRNYSNDVQISWIKQTQSRCAFFLGEVISRFLASVISGGVWVKKNKEIKENILLTLPARYHTLHALVSYNI